MATQPLSWPIGSNDSLFSCGYINACGNKDGCNGRMPCAIALIFISFGNVASGPFLNCNKFSNYFECSVSRYVLKAPVSAFIMSEVVVTILLFVLFEL